MTHANAGNASRLDNLPEGFLGKFNVSGNGRLQIEQDGQSPISRMGWTCQIPRGPRDSEVVRLSGVQKAPTNCREDFGRVLDASIHPDWIAPGDRGEKGGRLSGPVQFIRKLMEFWHLDDTDVVALLGFDPWDTEYVTKALHGGWELPGRDFKDRIAYLFRIRRTLWSLFRDLEVEDIHCLGRAVLQMKAAEWRACLQRTVHITALSTGANL